MTPPAGWRNPIMVSPGQVQIGVDPCALLPSRTDLQRWRLDEQRALSQGGLQRDTPLKVTVDGVIGDGHHAIRVAAEDGRLVNVLGISLSQAACGRLILDLPVR